MKLRKTIQRFAVTMAFAFTILTGCGEDDGDGRTLPAGIGSVLYHEGEAVTGASRMLHFFARLGGGELTAQGRLRASRVDWLNDKCGTIVHWELRGNDAWEVALDFYRGFPLTSKDDVDAFLENALLPRPLEPGETPPQTSEDRPGEPTWKFTFEPPYEPLAAELITQGHQNVVDAALELEHASRGMAIMYEVSAASTGSKAAEVFRYIEDFGDQQLRQYLERKNPKCLVH